MATILVLHGPNLNLLGKREPDIYGATTLDDINRRLTDLCLEAGHHLQVLQSNAEYELVDRIHDAATEDVNYIVINPAAF
ncbi:MAG: type II 3-dehydroquinate dehydratase, partial [Cellvibrionaceae bacterium]